MKKVIVSLCVGFGAVGLANAGESAVDTKTTATIEATCSISVDSVNFGVVSTPLMSQSAQSEMSVKCSNASTYTIDLAYGGVYGEGSSEVGNKAAYSTNGGDNVGYFIYNVSGDRLGLLTCTFAGANAGKLYLPNMNMANLFGYNNVGWQPNNGTCVTDGTLAGTHPNGWEGAYNAPGFIPIAVGSPKYAYGIMSGTSKGDKLAYSIAVPGDSNKVWNAGNNSYKNTGNGEFQMIPVVAKIVPDKSGSKYPAPDMYLDTVTAVISY